MSIFRTLDLNKLGLFVLFQKLCQRQSFLFWRGPQGKEPRPMGGEVTSKQTVLEEVVAQNSSVPGQGTGLLVVAGWAAASPPGSMRTL